MLSVAICEVTTGQDLIDCIIEAIYEVTDQDLIDCVVEMICEVYDPEVPVTIWK